MNKILLLTLVLVHSLAVGQVRLARLFSDHAVLQRQQSIPVWGWAKPGETVRATLSTQTQTAKADATGKWMVKFSAMEAGGPYELLAIAKSGKAQATDVLVGEVWLCSGQSNMEWPVKQADHFPEERQNANFPQIRHFHVDHELALQPQTELKTGDWRVSSAETVGDFTAVGFFFARELAKKLNIPIGLVHSSWGGSQVEGWISREGMLSNAELREPAQRLPTTWSAADSMIDRGLRKQLFGNPDQKLTLAEEQQYVDPTHDFSAWLKTDPIGQWQWKGLHGFRGKGFMSRQIEIPAYMVSQPTTLGLAENDSPNEVYINGKRVWEGTLAGVRKITLPANTWQTGVNRLVVKMGQTIEPAWYGMGLRGSATELYVATTEQRISLATDWKVMPSFAEPHTYTLFMNDVAATIYNSMIKPLVPFGMRGVLWYQGETNAGRAYQYRQSFPLLITDWRQQWGQDFSFYFVQLSSFGVNQTSNQGSNWAELREAQTMTLRLPKTGMAVTTDIGNPADIHPTNKQDVGHRLALNALRFDYGQATLNYSSPMFDSLIVSGSTAIVSFKHSAEGLKANDKYGYLRGFELAGDDHVFRYAQASINGNQVSVSHPSIPKPVAVRYGWADAPVDANLFNSIGLPASPFRTDDWPMLTRTKKFE